MLSFLREAFSASRTSRSFREIGGQFMPNSHPYDGVTDLFPVVHDFTFPALSCRSFLRVIVSRAKFCQDLGAIVHCDGWHEICLK